MNIKDMASWLKFSKHVVWVNNCNLNQIMTSQIKLPGIVKNESNDCARMIINNDFF